MKNFFTRPNYLGYFPFIALHMRDLFGACERAIAGSLGAFFIQRRLFRSRVNAHEVIRLAPFGIYTQLHLRL